MDQERIPTFIPGDPLVYRLMFRCEVNVSEVNAAFRNETTGAEIELKGEVKMISAPVVGARTFDAVLQPDEAFPEGTASGRYYLARLEVVTYRGQHLDFENPPEDAFCFEEEPENIGLTKLARGIFDPASSFALPDGHPNKPPKR